jgi:hypothetical protein
MVQCECAGYTLKLTGIDYDAIPAFLRAEREAGRRVLDLGDSRGRSQTAIHVVASANNRVHWELTVAEDCPSGFDDGDVVCVEDRLWLAIGRYVVCIEVASGAVLWTAECDSACCFGISALKTEPALIVHGELDISKLTYDGEIEWQSGGEDIFTGPFEIEETGIRAVDFNGTVYWIRLDTGESQIIGQGEPPWPHTR